MQSLPKYTPPNTTTFFAVVASGSDTASAMQAMGSGRPSLIPSLTRLASYSTEPPSRRSVKLVEELAGIVIPSRQDLRERDAAREREEAKAKAAKEAERQEARRKAEAYRADISYLQKAPERSLAGRLARSEAPIQLPKPRAPPRSPEEIEALTQQRREARLARDAERAKSVVRNLTPSSDMLKAIEDARNAAPPPHRLSVADPPHLPPAARLERGVERRTERGPERGLNRVPERDLNRGRPRQSEERKIPILSRIQERFSQPTVEPAASSEVENTSVETKAEEDDGLFKFTELNEKLAKAAEEDESQPGRKREIPQTIPLSERELEASQAAKRRQERLRHKEKVFTRDLPEELPASGLSASRQQALAASIAKRREQRLKRERQQAQGIDHNDDPEKYSLEKRKREKKKRRDAAKQTAIVQAEEDDLDIAPMEGEEEEEGVLPDFEGPEPVSTTLSEIVGFRQPSVALKNLSKAGNYNRYIDPHWKFATPVDELHPVHMAQLTLSHRAQLTLSQRKHCIDIISQAYQPRSSRPVART